jgi:hypothetical protein
MIALILTLISGLGVVRGVILAHSFVRTVENQLNLIVGFIWYMVAMGVVNGCAMIFFHLCVKVLWYSS